MSTVGPGVVLLAAGRGKRLSELTDKTHKSLLSVAGQPALSRIINELTKGSYSEMVVVTGYRAEDVAEAIQQHHRDAVSSIVFNARWAEDTNILSTEIGVSALKNSGNGYLIVETDIALDTNSWQQIRSTVGGPDSIWYTRGRYSSELTGGCLSSNDDGSVVAMAYAAAHDHKYDGWQKLIGLLYVSPGQVTADRRFRQAAISETTRQYYLQPYIDHRQELPCKSVDLGDGIALSFNDMAAYSIASESLTEAGR